VAHADPDIRIVRVEQHEARGPAVQLRDEQHVVGQLE